MRPSFVSMKRMASPSRTALTLVACGGLFACRMVGPDYTPPEIELPDSWHKAAVAGVEDGEADLRTWWTVFSDPVLDELLGRAANTNLDLERAAWAVTRARALRGITAADRVPTINLDGERNRQRISDNANFGPGGWRWNNSIGLGMAWELDLFGRVRRSVRAAEAEIEASIEDYRDTLVVLLAEVAVNYIDVRTLQQRIEYAESNVENQRGTLDLTKNLFDSQLVPELDVRQAELNLARTESLLPALRRGLAAAVHRIGVLLGEHPAAFDALLQTGGALPETPAELATTLPASLLRQRPDVRAAERALAAQTERIGVAVGDLYPRFELAGAFGFRSVSTGDLFEADSREVLLGIPFRWNLFDRKRIKSNVAAEEALAAQLQTSYEQTVLLALEEVENALVGYGQEGVRRGTLQRSVQAAEQSVELVRTQYRAGLTNFQNVLDTERALFQQQDELAASRGEQVRQLILLYRALGGGWDPEMPDSIPATLGVEEPAP